MLAELAQMFCDDARLSLATLRESIEERDTQAMERVAHSLKGSSGNMGAVKMAALCGELENVGAVGDLTRVPELLERLEVEFERVRSRLEDKIAES